jgi:hypothetical protein
MIMVLCKAANNRYLWDKNFESMLEDYHHTMSNKLKCVQPMVLKDIGDIVSDYRLPELDDQDAE